MSSRLPKFVLAKPLPNQFIYVTDENHTFVFRYDHDPLSRVKLMRLLAHYASNEIYPFTWVDAGRVSRSITQLAKQAKQ